MRKLASLLVLLFATQAQALTVKGNLTYSDGVNPISGTDVASVEVYDSAGNQLTKTAAGKDIVTVATSTYTIGLTAADIPGNDKSITLKFKLNGVLDRTCEGLNGRNVNPFGLIVDIGFTKAPVTPTPRASGRAITGIWCTANGVDPVTSAMKPSIVITYSDGSTSPGVIVITGTQTTFTLSPVVPAGATDKALKVEFLLNNVVDRTWSGVLGDDNRVQSISVNTK